VPAGRAEEFGQTAAGYSPGMGPLEAGTPAPPIDGVTFGDGPTAVFFFKVTCPVCQMAGPKAQAFEDAYPGRFVAVGQDPPAALEAFRDTYSMHVPAVSEPPPYRASNAYGVLTVPTLFLVGDDGVIQESVEGWDREGYNRVSHRLAELTGASYESISEPGDGLSPFRPG
jgi:thiol-disulfide isomerase/thioredoxin